MYSNNNLEMIENIMKPYFDKKGEIDSKPSVLYKEKEDKKNQIEEIRKNRINRRKELELELENLRVREKIVLDDFKKTKDREIEEYIDEYIKEHISEVMASKSNFFTVYASMLRRDLEQEYDKKFKEKENGFKEQEEQLISEIKILKSVSDIEKEEKVNLENFKNKTDFIRVDLRELAELKGDLRKPLLAEQKRLNFELREQQFNLDNIMSKYSTFNYIYDNNNQLINSDELKELLFQKHSISKKIEEIQIALEKTEKYLKLTELTEEDTKSLRASLTPWEKEEYDRRKGNEDNNNNNNENDNIVENEEPVTSKSEEKDENIESITKREIKELTDNLINQTENILSNESKPNETKDLDKEDIIERDDFVVADYKLENGKIITDKKSNLLKKVYNDIVGEIDKLRTVKFYESKGKLDKNEFYVGTSENNKDYFLNGIVNVTEAESYELPCGEYFNLNDYENALNDFYNKNKGQTYVVKETKKQYKITNISLEKCKKALKKCNMVKLVRDNKITKYDLLRVFGKSKSEDIIKEVEIGTLKDSNLPEGEYIPKVEAIFALQNLFETKSLSWLRNISDKLKQNFYSIDNEYLIDEVEEETKIK